MGSYSIGEALNLLFEKSGWKPKALELRLRNDWETIVGKTIARYTRNVYLKNQILTVYTDVPALKQELMFSKQQLIERINEYFGEKAVVEIVVK
jgi:predicted nucleic acid-binding Zn ribbon protein